VYAVVSMLGEKEVYSTAVTNPLQSWAWYLKQRQTYIISECLLQYFQVSYFLSLRNQVWMMYTSLATTRSCTVYFWCR